MLGEFSTAATNELSERTAITLLRDELPYAAMLVQANDATPVAEKALNLALVVFESFPIIT
jgi:hypothetical protein